MNDSSRENTSCTGRRVFQTVLTEFEKFLEHYFKNENEASRKGVSLAQQVEQRETLAIQYTIELRKMLNEVPVQEGVREFLFHVWADVLAMTAVKFDLQSEETKAMKRAAADLIWSASAKVSREERAEVIRRLPPLLKTLRDGMHGAGVPAIKQDEHIQKLNNSLAAAFTAKAAAIPHDRLEELMARLETLEELLPDAEDVEIDESLVLDLSGHEAQGADRAEAFTETAGELFTAQGQLVKPGRVVDRHGEAAFGEAPGLGAAGRVGADHLRPGAANAMLEQAVPQIGHRAQDQIGDGAR